jgi:plasmid stabilization system protein ParE
MWDVVFRPEAKRDIVKATRWYAKQNPQLGEVFADAVDSTVAAVLENPYLYAIVKRQSRRARVTGFRDGSYYRIADDHVVITACTHFRRHPRHWRAG